MDVRPPGSGSYSWISSRASLRPLPNTTVPCGGDARRNDIGGEGLYPDAVIGFDINEDAGRLLQRFTLGAATAGQFGHRADSSRQSITPTVHAFDGVRGDRTMKDSVGLGTFDRDGAEQGVTGIVPW